MVARPARNRRTRDYFRVESRTGVRAWLYREGLYGREPNHRKNRDGICRGCSRERRSFRFVRTEAAPAEVAPPPRYRGARGDQNFSFLRGASDLGELVETAKRSGLAGLGIADRNSVAGVVRAHVMAKNRHERFVSGNEKRDDRIPARRRRPIRFLRRHARHPRLSAAIAPPGAGSRGCYRSASAGREGRLHSRILADLLDICEASILCVMPPSRLRPARQAFSTG